MIINKSGLVFDVAPDADPAHAAKVAQFLANSTNVPVIAKCMFGEVVVTHDRPVTAADFVEARKAPDEREDAPAAVEAMPVEEPPLNVPAALKPQRTAKK